MATATMAVRYRSSTGSALISVTQVLSLAGRIDSEWFTPESALRGQVVHDLTETLDALQLDSADLPKWRDHLPVPDELQGYIDAYAEFLQVVRPVYEASELKVTNGLLGLGGRIDRVCSSIWGTRGLLDFKTGEPMPWHGQQLSAYNVLHPTGSRWACYLGKAGRYRLQMHEDPQDHRKFMFDLATTRGTVTAFGDHWVSI
jgi:hypothetical protein